MSGETPNKFANGANARPQPIPKTQKEQKDGFERIVQQYLDSNPLIRIDNKISELEVRFGTNPKVARPISKIDYDNVVKQLYACGFTPENDEGINMLRIQNEYTDLRTGAKKMSNVRAEIMGLDLIQEYCHSNSLQKLIDMPTTIFNKIKFTQKMTATSKSGELVRKLDVEDFNFRVSYQTEQDYHVQSNFGRKITDKWNDSLKIFRSMNRVRFRHAELPIFADLTIVKTSKKTNYVVVPQYTIQEADVFNGVGQYEVELEVDNNRVGYGTDYNTLPKLMTALRKCIRIVLSGIQGTKFPISYKERDGILHSYMQLINGKTDDIVDEKYVNYKHVNKPQRITSSQFIGPSSYTLQMEHVVDNNIANMTTPNIRKDYTVTDKADGDRKLLYINSEGKIYMIDTNMNIIFTGTKTREKTMFDSLLDGEHIKHDKHGKFINLYAAFDVYYIHEKSVRDLPFVSNAIDANEIEYRLPLLYKFIDVLNPVSILANDGTGEVKPKHANVPCDFRVQSKTFYYENENMSIFEGCSKILSNKEDGLFEYNTDGLIFTPSTLAVGGEVVGGPPGPKTKSAWLYSLKWKPPEFNTIDFLVTVKQNKMAKDEIHHIFQDGKNLMGVQNVSQYKTLILQCGYSEKLHGYMNPCQMILDDNLPKSTNFENNNNYKPVPFQPTNPYNDQAYLCNIMLVESKTQLLMKTEEGEYFDKDTIVEFKYEMNNADGWRWIPLRVRYDKTEELLSGVKKQYGNAYHVANNNWQSIHNPITNDMISTGNNIPVYVDEVYYNGSIDKTNTQSLRNFHNLYVKSKLIMSVSRRGDTLIDYAVGKGGDLSKWIYSHLKFVFGTDYSKDNIHNQKDGACSRYLKAKTKHKVIPDALFVHGDSGLNIRSGESFNTEKDKQIANAVFGSGPKDAVLLGKGVFKNYGVAESGFQISSCQFAMHYFFKDVDVLHQFMRNLAECTKVNGYYIGTCYDGKTVFDLLRSKPQNEGIAIFKGDRKIYELTRMYNQTGFPDDDMSVGYPIDVYQESINKVFREYLVNFTYFTQLMEDYGFILITKEEAVKMGMPNSTGLFGELFATMENEIKINPKLKIDYKDAVYMSQEEKQISFLNRYFVFKKMRHVDAKKLGEIIGKQVEIIDKLGVENVKEMEINDVNIEPTKPKVKKTERKIVLKPFKPALDESIEEDVKPVKKPRLNIIGKRET
mgnify:CR=1 FL=1